MYYNMIGFWKVPVATTTLKASNGPVFVLIRKPDEVSASSTEVTSIPESRRAIIVKSFSWVWIGCTLQMRNGKSAPVIAKNWILLLMVEITFYQGMHERREKFRFWRKNFNKTAKSSLKLF
jgi:hypothetical protein